MQILDSFQIWLLVAWTSVRLIIFYTEVSCKRRDAKRAEVFLTQASNHLEEAKKLADKNKKSSDRVQNLKTQVARLEHERRCKICWNEQSAMVFLPCRHICTCMTCGDLVTVCPICRSITDDGYRVFIA